LTVRPVLHRLVRRHAEDAAFYWARWRESATGNAADMRTLRRFEQMLEANLEGLRVADRHPGGSRAGLAAARDRLLRWRTADEAFVVAVLELPGAAEHASAGMEALVSMVCDEADLLHPQGELLSLPPVARGLASAMGWLQWPEIEATVRNWAQRGEPVLRWIALAALALHRQTLVPPWLAWLGDPAPAVRARAMRACGELSIGEAIPRLEAALGDPVATCRHAAAAGLAMLGERAAVSVLTECIEAAARQADSETDAHRLQRAWLAQRRSCWLLAPLLSPAECDEQVRCWFADAALRRPALELARFGGNPAHLPALVEVMRREIDAAVRCGWRRRPALNLARLAGDAFSHITGVQIGQGPYWLRIGDIEADEGEIESDPAVPAAHRLDPDHGLPWPSPDALQEWLIAWPGGASPPQVAGRSLGPEHAHRLLADGLAPQPRRLQAALHLRLTGHHPVLFDAGARTSRRMNARRQTG
jgi:uncharacterized protein (TIGR02270 family)